MNISVALGVWTLLAVLIWPRVESIYVKLSCSMDWMMVSVSPCGDSSNLYIFADELYLGSGCPATRIQTYAYDFIYPVHDCGIRIKVVSEDTLLLQTEIYFNPQNLHCDRQKIPLECYVSRKSVWLTPVSTEDEIKLDPSPFITDFETTPEELGLLSSSHIVPSSRKNGDLELASSILLEKLCLFVLEKVGINLFLDILSLKNP